MNFSTEVELFEKIQLFERNQKQLDQNVRILDSALKILQDKITAKD